MTPARVMVAGTLVAVLALAESEARHTVLAVVAALAFLAAGAGFLLRFRVTGTSTARDVGLGLTLLGLHRPAARACDALLAGRHAEVTSAVTMLVMVAAAAYSLRAVPGSHPRRRVLLIGSIVAMIAVGGLVQFVTRPAANAPLALTAHGVSVVLAAGLWTVVAAAAWRSDSFDLPDRRSVRALSGIALSVAAVGLLRAAPGVVPDAATAAQVIGDLGLLGIAATAVVVAVRRLDDSLVGQERYVSGLLEQLSGHERHLQAVRGSLHDARAAVAGAQAGSSAVRYLSATADAQARAELEDAVCAELARVQRMLRLPERAPSVAPVDLDTLVRPLVVSHRERGLRVAWAPAGHGSVAVDGDAVAVIVGNLLGNALVHAPGARCSVDVEVGDRLTITVADDGPGLSPARRAAAFEAGARRPGSPGEGLGLAISRDLARRHGGDLLADDPVAGSRFVLTLPLAPSPVPVVLPRPRLAAESGPVLRSVA